ncbi:T-box transcription factor TBX22 [Patella vulgata]|uniref:T-box transcription factor TBX22 n=1 Tax=Patella vulgata TaxID=6465 RepID=UPI0024A91E3E|nr:T-box transcription factor TBX22 [Patella vulgata]
MAYMTIAEVINENSNNTIQVELHQNDLWTSFHRIGTEMIITKNGRRMFPAPRIKIWGTESLSLYKIYIDFISPDTNKYRYHYQSSRWMSTGKTDSSTCSSSEQTCLFNRPISGSYLQEQTISFEKLKLTNNPNMSSGKVCLRSMQNYYPRITVVKVSDLQKKSHSQEIYHIIFPQTSFISVTAYQNQNITQLKIARNPFAKGFRAKCTFRHSIDSSQNLLNLKQFQDIKGKGPQFGEFKSRRRKYPYTSIWREKPCKEQWHCIIPSIILKTEEHFGTINSHLCMDQCIANGYCDYYARHHQYKYQSGISQSIKDEI